MAESVHAPSPKQSAKKAVAQSITLSRDGAIAALDNAQRHMRCTDALARRREYGVARGHLVLAVEEAVKGLGLAIRALDFEIPEDQLEALLFRHDARHANALGYMLLSTIAEKLWNTLNDARAHYPNPTDADKRAMRKKALADFLSWAERQTQLPPEDDPLKAAIDWLADANERRNAAFYVDLKDGQWESPGVTTREDFKRDHATARRVVTRITEHAAAFLESDQPTRQRMHEMHDQLRAHLAAQVAAK